MYRFEFYLAYIFVTLREFFSIFSINNLNFLNKTFEPFLVVYDTFCIQKQNINNFCF